MPTLTRYVVVLGIFAALAYGVMYALVTFVEPRKTEMSVEIPLQRLNKKAAP
jgi:hypothetical protein